MISSNEETFEIIQVRLPTNLATKVRAEAERQGAEAETFIAATIAACIAQTEDDMNTLDYILHAKMTDEERAAFSTWTDNFARRYDQALRNLAK